MQTILEARNRYPPFTHARSKILRTINRINNHYVPRCIYYIIRETFLGNHFHNSIFSLQSFKYNFLKQNISTSNKTLILF